MLANNHFKDKSKFEFDPSFEINATIERISEMDADQVSNEIQEIWQFYAAVKCLLLRRREQLLKEGNFTSFPEL